MDVSFLSTDGTTNVCLILHRFGGFVIFAAYRCIFNCNDALKVEIHSLMQGVTLACQYTDLSVLVQSYYFEALAILSNDAFLRSTYGHLVREIKHLMVGQEFIPHKLNRC